MPLGDGATPAPAVLTTPTLPPVRKATPAPATLTKCIPSVMQEEPEGPIHKTIDMSENTPTVMVSQTTRAMTDNTVLQPPKRLCTSTRKRKSSALCKILANFKEKRQVGDSSQKKNKCFVCGKLYGRSKGPWVGCKNENICNSWAHNRCVGWSKFSGEDVTDKEYICPHSS